jgi:hypothetical protein
MAYEKKRTLAWEVTTATITLTVLSHVGPCGFLKRYQYFR